MIGDARFYRQLPGGGRKPQLRQLPRSPMPNPHQPTVVLTTCVQLNTIKTVPTAQSHQAI
jgi:hypothetical protein